MNQSSAPPKILNEREYQQQLETYKAQRLKKIVKQLSSSGLRFDVLLTVTEIKKIINDEAKGSYDSGIFASIILNCQDELKKNKNKMTLYHFFEKYTELEFKLIHEREYQTTRLTENSSQYNNIVDVLGDPNQNPRSRPSVNMLSMEILEFAYGPEILTDLDEDRFELFISTRRTKANMMIRHSYLEYLIEQKQYPIFKLEIEDLTESVAIKISDLYEKRMDQYYEASEQYLEVQDFADEKQHNLVMSFVNDIGTDAEELLIELKVRVRYTALKKYVNHSEEMVKLKDQEKAILQARDAAITKLAAVQKIFDDKSIETANQHIDQLNSPPKRALETKSKDVGDGANNRPSYRARLFATPVEEEQDEEDEIMRFYNGIISKVSQINYGYIFLSILASFYRTDFVDISIGVTFYACSKVNNQLAYYSDIACVFIIAVLYSLICDFIWLGLNHSQFFTVSYTRNPDSIFTRIMLVVSYILLFYKIIVMLSYVKYISKHHKDGEMLRRNQAQADLENRRLPADRKQQRQTSKKSAMVVRKV